MNRRFGWLLAVVCLLFTVSITSSAQVPIVIYPNPVQFGTVPVNSNYSTFVIVNNISLNPVQVTGMSISGTNVSDFAFNGPTCVGPISGGQSCQMSITFTPAVLGPLSANLVVAFVGAGSPVTIPLLGTGVQANPTISSLSPPTAYVGAPGITLKVNGTGYIAGSTVNWYSQPLPTTFVSSVQLTAQVPATYLNQIETASVTVSNPGGGTSPYVGFSVVDPVPVISSLAPYFVVAGTAATLLTVNGNSFAQGARVLLDGVARPTTYINSQQLQVQLSKTELAKPTIAQVTVANPAPGSVSTFQNFNVTYPALIRVLNLPANDLVWDPFAQKIYASLPSSFGENGNSIAVINPADGTVSGYYFVGSEPSQLALSADSKYLYVGLNGNGSVQRLILPGFTPDINVSLGNNGFGESNTAIDLAVSPADPHSFAVSISTASCCGGGQLEFFTDSTLLPNSVTNPQIASFQFANPSTLYGYSNGTVSQVSVDSSGGTLVTDWNGVINGSGGIHYDAGVIYGNEGQVMNPATGELIGSYDVGNLCCGYPLALLPESSINRTLVAGVTPFFPALGVTSYNLTEFTPVGVISLSSLNGSVGPNLIPWGNDGLALVIFLDCCGGDSVQTVLIQSPIMQPVSNTNNPAPVGISLSPSNALHAGGNFRVTIKGSGFVPGSQAIWNGSERSVTYVSSTELTMYVPWSDIASPGTARVSVTNPTPGGGTANVLLFTID